MARQPATDPWPAFREAAAAGALADQPRTLFQAVERALGDVVGHKLFTVALEGAAADGVPGYFGSPPTWKTA